jgi:hypothetical protein
VRRETAEDLAFTRLASLYVIPLLLPLIGGGKYLSIEDASIQGLASQLDRDAGIDGYQCHPDGKLWRSVASRMQEERPWMRGRCPSTFTVRDTRASGAETEFSKRSKALQDEFGATRPDLVVQGYVRDRRGGACFGAAVVRGDDFYAHVLDRWDRLPRREVSERGRALFRVVHWKDLEVSGAKIRIWRPQLTEVERERLACQVVGIHPDDLRQMSDEKFFEMTYAKSLSLIPTDGGRWILQGPISLRESLLLSKTMATPSTAVATWIAAQKDQQRWRDLASRRCEVQMRLGEAFFSVPAPLKSYPEAAE